MSESLSIKSIVSKDNSPFVLVSYRGSHTTLKNIEARQLGFSLIQASAIATRRGYTIAKTEKEILDAIKSLSIQVKRSQITNESFPSWEDTLKASNFPKHFLPSTHSVFQQYTFDKEVFENITTELNTSSKQAIIDTIKVTINKNLPEKINFIYNTEDYKTECPLIEFYVGAIQITMTSPQVSRCARILFETAEASETDAFFYAHAKRLNLTYSEVQTLLQEMSRSRKCNYLEGLL